MFTHSVYERKMLKLKLCITITIIFLVGMVRCDSDNATRLDESQDLILNFPKYLKIALNSAMDANEQKFASSTDPFFKGNLLCFRDFLRVFAGLKQKNLWAIRGTNTWIFLQYSKLNRNNFFSNSFLHIWMILHYNGCETVIKLITFECVRLTIR